MTMTNTVHEAPGKGKVEVRHYKPLIESTSPPKVVVDFMKQWPNGNNILEAFSNERIVPKQKGDATFWQAAFRWSLLRKYNKLSSKHLQEPYSFVVDDIDDDEEEEQRPTKRQKKEEEFNDDTNMTKTKAKSMKNNNPRRVLEFSKQDIETITKLWEEQCDLASAAAAAAQEHNKNNTTTTTTTNHDDDDNNDLTEFLVSATSNRRQLQWTFLDCGPACQFKLHAHPNMEMIYCVSGALHEIRMEGKPITKTFPPAAVNDNQHQDDDDKDNNLQHHGPEIMGPDLTSLGRPWKFDTLLEGDILVNEVGSIHRSFCSTNGGCLLFVLWGGSHADIPQGQEPTRVNIQQAMDKMDQRVSSFQQQQQASSSSSTTKTSCGCGSSSWTTLSETFLPESERSI